MKIASMLVIAAASALAGCAAQPSPTTYAEPARSEPPEPPTKLRKLTAAEQKRLGDLLSQSLKDPGSAQWKWAAFPFPLGRKETLTYCAQVNAKNSYGGYGGFKVFIAVVTVENGKILHATIGAIQDSAAQYSEIVPKMCADKGRDPYAVA